MSSISEDKQPLPLSDILRDLALIRASDVDLAGVLLDGKDTAKGDGDVDSSVQRSYEFVKEARAALRIQNKGDLDRAGEDIELIREKIEDVLKGLGAS